MLFLNLQNIFLYICFDILGRSQLFLNNPDDLDDPLISILTIGFDIICTEAVARRYSVKKVFLKVLQNSQKNTCVRVSF